MEAVTLNHGSVAVENDTLLPDQFWSPPAPPPIGEMALLWTVFADGVRCYQEAISRGATRGADFREVEQWILSRDTRCITSFRNLCDVFGIDAGALRRRLLQLRYEAERSRF